MTQANTDKSAMLYQLRQEQVDRNSGKLRSIVQYASDHRQLTPKAVMAYAGLHLRRDDGMPLVPAAHHRLWLHLLCDERIKKLMIIAPPESAKTTWAISAFVGTYIGVFPERSVIIGSASGPIAEKRALSLRLAVESPEWQVTFPNIKPAQGLPWTRNEWSIAPGGVPQPGRLHPTVAAYGTGGSVIGSRADLVVADDLLDFDNTRTDWQRDFVNEWLHRSLLSRRKSQTGRAVIIGTAWHHDDLYARARSEGGWVVVHVPLLADEKEVYATLSYPDDWDGPVLGEALSTAKL